MGTVRKGKISVKQSETNRETVQRLENMILYEAVLAQFNEYAFLFSKANKSVMENLPSRRLRQMLLDADDIASLWEMVKNMKTSDVSSESEGKLAKVIKLLEQFYGKEQDEIDFEKMIDDARLLEEVKKNEDVYERIKKRWKEPLLTLLQMAHYQKSMVKIYYQMIFDARSPLRIGNGRDCSSDSDLMLDGRGLPFIPGTSIAGIVRHRVEEINGNKAMLERLFGTVEIAETSNCDPRIIPSAIFFSDAVMNQDASEKDVVIGKRDGVGLGEWGTAKNTSKFDFLISELDKKLYAVIEWTGDEKQEKTEIDDIIDPVMKHYISSGFHAGARTSRGYGDFKVEIRKKIFMFPAELEKWIEFDPYADDAFLNAVELSGGLLDMNVEIEVGFKMVGTFSVRVNTARSKIMEDGSVPDTVPLEDHSGNPVIPGTVWAGAFRHHMHDIHRGKI